MGAARDVPRDPRKATAPVRPSWLARRDSVSIRSNIRPTPVSPAPASSSAPPQPRLLNDLCEALRSRHYSPRTERTYCHWVKRYIFLHNVRHPAEMAAPEINAVLTHRAVNEKVSTSTQSPAFCAIRFLNRHILGHEIGIISGVVRGHKPMRLPMVLTREKVKAVLARLSGNGWLMGSLRYGAGLRLAECLRLHAQDIDFSRREILVRDGKGVKDRVTMLPKSLKAPLHAHLKTVKEIHDRDLAEGWGRVHMPMALDRKCSSDAMAMPTEVRHD